jgi:hypothetical protein
MTPEHLDLIRELISYNTYGHHLVTELIDDISRTHKLLKRLGNARRIHLDESNAGFGVPVSSDISIECIDSAARELYDAIQEAKRETIIYTRDIKKPTP